MCGIAGFIGTYSGNVLRAMNEVIAHRGPDDVGYFEDPLSGVGLAHRRLSIIDLSSAGHQPMWDAQQQAAIVFNGEIYNYREIARQLHGDGFRFNSTCDTEVILNLYLRDGIACIAQLNGIFAFAIWDSRTKTILLARDGVGVKPLYYTQTKRGLSFASEIKALCKVPDLDRSLDLVALSQYLTYLYCPAPRTPFKAVHKLLPGEAMVVNRGGIEKRWQFYRQKYDQEIATLSVADAEEELIDRLSRAVRRQMIADVPVGSFLSGGLDSSAIVALARQFACGGEIPCYTIGFRNPGRYKEGVTVDLPYAENVAQHLSVKLNTVWVDSAMSDGLAKMVWHLDEPLADPAAMNVYQIAKMARSQGVKVLLSGAGGDDIFCGYRRHQALMWERWWGWLPRGARAILREASDTRFKNTPLGRRCAKAFQYADSAPERRLAGYFAWLRREQVLGLFSPAARFEIEATDPLEPMLAALEELPTGTPAINQMLYLDSKYFLTDHNLNYTDKMSMAAGVEVRVPFLDPDLMAFAARLPIQYKQHGMTGKWLLKRAMETYLPRSVVYRPKTGFGVPLRSWMRDEMRGSIDAALSPGVILKRGLFDGGAVRHLLEIDRVGDVDASYPIFALMCIETWMRCFHDV